MSTVATSPEVPEKFVQIPLAILRDQRLSDGAKLLWGQLASFAWFDKTEVYPSQATLAWLMGCSERKVRRCLRELEQPDPDDDHTAGYIEVVHRGLTQTNVYRIIEESPVTGPDRTQVTVPDRTPASDEVDEVEVDEKAAAAGEAEKNEEAEPLDQETEQALHDLVRLTGRSSESKLRAYGLDAAAFREVAMS